MPDRLFPGPRWLLPSITFVLMVSMLILDPGRIDRRGRRIRLVQIAILVVLAVGTTYATVALADALVVGSAGITNFGNVLRRVASSGWRWP